jgi:tetratricopeptide (TPR) repeat protein
MKPLGASEGFVAISTAREESNAPSQVRSRVAILIVVLFMGASLRPAAQQSAATGKPPFAQTSAPLAEAKSALSRGDPTKAIEILSDYLKFHPTDVSARLLLGQAYLLAGQTNAAEAEYQTILNVGPTNVSALTGLGEVYMRAGQFEKAEPILHRAVKASNGAPRIRMQWVIVLARLHQYKEAQTAMASLTPPSETEQRIQFHRLNASVASGLGDLPTAAAEMEKALALRPHDAALAMATAVAELQSGNGRRVASLAGPLYSSTHDPQVGLVLLEAHLATHEDFHEILSAIRTTALQPAEELALRQRLAEVLIAHGEFAPAIDDLQRTVELDPSRGDLAYNLALGQFKAGHIDDALKSAEKCKAIGDTAEVEDLLGDIQETGGDSLNAARSYQAAVTLAPNTEQYRLSLAVEFLRHNNFDAARLVLKQAETVWPKSWRIQLALAMVENFAGSDEESSRLLMHAAGLAPEPEISLQYLGQLQMDRAAAPTPAAIAEICEYSGQHPNNGKMHYYCAALVFRRDHTLEDKSHADEILRGLLTASTLLTNDASPHCQLGAVYRWLERWQDAVRASETCVRMDPDSADGHYRLAQLYQHLGEQERSQQEMNLFQVASKRIADQNARRDETMKTFLYTIQKATPEHN